MKKFYSIIIFHIIINLTIEGAEYVEAPFQKYGVMLTQKMPEKFSGEIFSMVLFGEKFLCGLPNEEEILLERNIIYPDITVLTERINAMPCLLWIYSEWFHVVCPHYIYQIHKRNFTYNILGIRYSDNYKEKSFEGFWGKGVKTFYTRHFVGEKICGTFKDDIRTTVWYLCRQSKEENAFFFQQISSCEYEIRIFTHRVCSGYNFESETGHQLHCYAEKDAMALVLTNEDRTEPPSFNSDILPNPPKGTRGDVFFVVNANVKLNQESDYGNGPHLVAEEICEKKLTYRADEIISVAMGVPFNFSVDSYNKSEDHEELMANVMSFLHPAGLYKWRIFDLYPLHDIVENIQKMMHPSKKNKKKKKYLKNI